MSINLVKGQKIDLTKSNAGLSSILVGLGWDPAERSGGGMLGGLFGGKTAQVDCDASVLLLDSNNKLRSKADLIYFGNLRNQNSSIIHQGDNLTGDGEGDDEQILLDLNNIPQEIQKAIFVVNIYDCVKRKQDFGMIKNAFIRIVDATGNKELCKYNLTESYAGKTTLVVGEIYRHGSEWKFGAIGEGTNEPGLREIVARYQ
ncbi:MAG: TerD family protein [Tissierellales bacterium]|jgi:stress response protein SCP2|nr:TerD family protein [Tissierellales bacterium]